MLTFLFLEKQGRNLEIIGRYISSFSFRAMALENSKNRNSSRYCVVGNFDNICRVDIVVFCPQGYFGLWWKHPAQVCQS